MNCRPFTHTPSAKRGCLLVLLSFSFFKSIKAKRELHPFGSSSLFWNFEVCLSACITYLDKIMSFQNSYKQIVLTLLLFRLVKFPPCSNKSHYRNLPNFQNWTMIYYKQRQNKYSSKIPPVKKCNSIPYFTYDQEGVLCRGKIL